jgi:hypothetical protein
MQVHGHLSADQYQAMIAASGAIEPMNARHGQTCWVVEYDGASSQWAQTTKQSLERLCLMLSLHLRWLANRPDRNVSENVSAILKRGMATQDSGTVDELREEVRKAWNSIPFGEIKMLVDSFDSLIQGAMVLHGESGNG